MCNCPDCPNYPKTPPELLCRNCLVHKSWHEPEETNRGYLLGIRACERFQPQVLNA